MVQLFLIQLAIKWLFKFSPHPTYAFALPGEIKTHEINVKMNKKCQKPFVTLLIFRTFGHQMAIQIFSSPNICICITWRNITNATWDEIRKNVSKFHYSRYISPNSPDRSSFDNICSIMQQRVYGTLFRTANELKNRLVKVWSRTASTLLSTNGECISLPVFTKMADILNIYC